VDKLRAVVLARQYHNALCHGSISWVPPLLPKPHFLGIGAQKCGTTWLFTHLQNHPDVSFPGGKEIHFWDRKTEKGIDWWLDHFAHPDGTVQGEITPAYATLDIDIIRQIRTVVPDVRLFYSIRNPMARAWSSALMLLHRADMTLDEASDRWFLDHFQSRGSRRRGDYLACLDAWLSVFPPGQLHLILFDDIVSDPRSVLAGLAHHLAIDPAAFDRIPDDTLRRPIFSGPRCPLRPTLLEALMAMYRPSIEHLQDHLGRDLSNWLTWTGV
jgi:hypothetical protein